MLLKESARKAMCPKNNFREICKAIEEIKVALEDLSNFFS